MKPAHDHLVAKLEAMRASLDAGDAESVALMMDDAVTAFGRTIDPFGDPRVLALFHECQDKATRLLSRLHTSVDSHATSRRAATAYGSHP